VYYPIIFAAQSLTPQKLGIPAINSKCNVWQVKTDKQLYFIAGLRPRTTPHFFLQRKKWAKTPPCSADYSLGRLAARELARHTANA
jgi:hypothetical protein